MLGAYAAAKEAVAAAGGGSEDSEEDSRWAKEAADKFMAADAAAGTVMSPVPSLNLSGVLLDYQ